MRRIHQEDLCQAFGIPPERKYEETVDDLLERLPDAIDAAAEETLGVPVELVIRRTTRGGPGAADRRRR